ncbi:hypothetical protein BIW11_13108, partial [Tropilaelaps mercedesae]
HKKKVEHFLPCKANQVPGAPGQSQVPGAPGINPLLLNSNHTATLHPFLQADGLNPIEPPDQTLTTPPLTDWSRLLQLSDVKCGAYGTQGQGQGFTTLPSAFRGIVTPSVISLNDPQRSQRRKQLGAGGGPGSNKEQYNPIYEQVLDQDRQEDEHKDDEGSSHCTLSSSKYSDGEETTTTTTEPRSRYTESADVTARNLPPRSSSAFLQASSLRPSPRKEATSVSRRFFFAFSASVYAAALVFSPLSFVGLFCVVRSSSASMAGPGCLYSILIFMSSPVSRRIVTH